MKLNLLLYITVILLIACNTDNISRPRKKTIVNRRGWLYVEADSVKKSQALEADSLYFPGRLTGMAMPGNEDNKLLISKGTNNRIYIYDYWQLKELYRDKYLKVYYDFNAFKKDVWTETIILNFDGGNEHENEYYYLSVPFNSDIYKLYLRTGLNGLVNKYCKINNDVYLFKETFTTEENINVSYYFMKNGYRLERSYNFHIEDFRKDSRLERLMLK